MCVGESWQIPPLDKSDTVKVKTPPFSGSLRSILSCVSFALFRFVVEVFESSVLLRIHACLHFLPPLFRQLRFLANLHDSLTAINH